MSEPLKIYTAEGKLEDGIVERLIKQMQEDGISEERIKHAIKNQLIPQLFSEMVGDKERAQVHMVKTNLSGAGHLVTCHKCGKQAKMATAPPEGFVATCPQCLMNLADDESPTQAH